MTNDSATDRPTVTVVTPVRNEAADIRRCIEHLARQDHPLDDVEVIVVDGASTDGTPDIVRAALTDSPFGWTAVLTNPAGSTPSNLNVGLHAARGRIVVRVDARSLVPSTYLRRIVEILDGEPEVAVVGGAQRAIARDGSSAAVGIARALNNRFTMGGARYRSGGASGPTDTVYLGAFRSDQLRQVGGWDPELPTNQDFDLNRRMAEFGSVWFASDLQVGYLPRTSHRELWDQYRRFGSWKVRYWRSTGDRPQTRQIVALAAGPVAAAILLTCIALPRRSRWIALALLSSAAVLVEHSGTSGPDGMIPDRAASLAAIASTTGAWTVGVWQEFGIDLLRHRPRR